MQNDQYEELLTIAQLASKFGVSRSSIRNMVLNDSIPYIMIDYEAYFNEEQIKVWQEELIKERYDKPLKIILSVGEREKLEYHQHFRCLLCEYTSSVEVYTDDTVYGIVEKIKRNHKVNSIGCENEIQDIQILKGQEELEPRKV